VLDEREAQRRVRRRDLRQQPGGEAVPVVADPGMSRERSEARTIWRELAQRIKVWKNLLRAALLGEELMSSMTSTRMLRTWRKCSAIAPIMRITAFTKFSAEAMRRG
jgi:hypothetical protein